ncbi:MAG: hypothetical protein COV72_07740 [Candidatus Omnitrophica bacterium CG11_big_fil_rev_8_21_14_0_20_42_13]|uniref:Pilus assembly protein PilO n=1 Tax=Candidatus Ghiorseimicrobium undicola TaxID=1974746 RepID=A0A2H0LVU2_9BACT|nr:MAG: hypothetical protein COV72_07740 [Candidatus Omnitrophica bacterium CG11_big_fil_rev_8_21_14_0_20_42_13]
MHLARKNNKDKQICYAIIGGASFIALAMGAAFYSSFSPAVKEMAQMNTKIKKGQVIVPDSEGYRKQREDLDARIIELREEIKESKERLFWKKDIALFLQRLSIIAKELAIDFINIKPSLSPEPIRSREDRETVLMFRNPINITLKTGHKELMRFLKRIEESDKFLRIDDIDILVNSKDIFKRDVTMVLSIFSAD